MGEGWVGADTAYSSPSNQRGCPRISSVVTQPRAPWRSFRQLSRTRPAAVLNSSLQRPPPDEQLQHTGQFPYEPSPPPPSTPPPKPTNPLSFAHSSSAYACRHFDCANEQNSPSPPPPPPPSQTHSLAR